jgi:hypothetical protein
MDEYSLQSLLNNLGLLQGASFNQQSYRDLPTAAQLANEKLNAEYESLLGSSPNMPMRENLGINPSDLSYAMMPYQGAPYSESPVSLLGGGGSMQSANTQGFAMGGRAGLDIPLDEKVRIALGVQGVSTDVTYGMGQEYGGRYNRADITGIDATLRDLAKNREFGAEVKKDFSGNPFVSGFFRQRF